MSMSSNNNGTPHLPASPATLDALQDRVRDAPYDEELQRNAAQAIIEPIQRLTRDLKAASVDLRPGEVRYLVSLYYEMQEQRIRAAAQVRTSQEQGEPNQLLAWMYDNYERLEGDIRLAMRAWVDTKQEGRWLMSLVGIGPVLAAGHMAHIDIMRADSPAHIWSLAGANPLATWKKGQKRPWNAQLKVLRWKAGKSFVKSSGSERSQYGPIYRARKDYETTRNELFLYREQAERILAERSFREDTTAFSYYVRGMLPPGHIQARVERYVAKTFLADLWSVLWDIYRPNEAKPDAYAIAHLGHAERRTPPNWPLVE